MDFNYMKKYATCFLLTLITGCAGISQTSETTKRGVTNDNVFFSDNKPALSVKINKEFTYFGHYHEKKFIQYTDGNGGAYQNFDSYYFIKPDNKRISKMITIEISNINFGFYGPDIYSWMHPSLKSETTNYLGEYYQTGITVSGFACNDTKRTNLFINKGYILPNAFLLKATGRRLGYNGNYLFHIYYAEDINQEQLNPINVRNNTLNDEEKSLLDSFSKRAVDSFSFLNVSAPKDDNIQLINLN